MDHVERRDPGREALRGSLFMRVTDNLNAVRNKGTAYFACVRCRGELVFLTGTHKVLCIQEDPETKHAVSPSGDWTRLVDAKDLFRRCFCGALIENKVVMETSILQEVALMPEAVSAVATGLADSGTGP
jgi:hypothetical protein